MPECFNRLHAPTTGEKKTWLKKRLLQTETMMGFFLLIYLHNFHLTGFLTVFYQHEPGVLTFELCIA